MTFLVAPEFVPSSLHTSPSGEQHGDSTCSSDSSCSPTPTGNGSLERIPKAAAAPYPAKIRAESQPDRRVPETRGSAKRRGGWSKPRFTCRFVGTRPTCISLCCFCTDRGTPVSVLKDTTHRMPGAKQTLAETDSKSKASVPSPKLSQYSTREDLPHSVQSAQLPCGVIILGST